MVREIASRGRCVVRGKRKKSTREAYFRAHHLICRWGGRLFGTIAGVAMAGAAPNEAIACNTMVGAVIVRVTWVLLELVRSSLEVLGYC